MGQYISLQTRIRAAQTGVFDLDIRISHRPFIDVCKSFASETGLKSRNSEVARCRVRTVASHLERWIRGSHL
jgi:hypothetical protein